MKHQNLPLMHCPTVPYILRQLRAYVRQEMPHHFDFRKYSTFDEQTKRQVLALAQEFLDDFVSENPHLISASDMPNFLTNFEKEPTLSLKAVLQITVCQFVGRCRSFEMDWLSQDDVSGCLGNGILQVTARGYEVSGDKLLVLTLCLSDGYYLPQLCGDIGSDGDLHLLLDDDDKETLIGFINRWGIEQRHINSKLRPVALVYWANTGLFVCQAVGEKHYFVCEMNTSFTPLEHTPLFNCDSQVFDSYKKAVEYAKDTYPAYFKR